MTAPLLELRLISKEFGKHLDIADRIARRLGAGAGNQNVKAVDKVDLGISKGEVLGLVGESGCGKSTLGRIVAQIHAASSGTLIWKGTDVDEMNRSERRSLNLSVQMIFQDPSSSLNPRLQVRDIIGEAALVNRVVSRAELDDYVAQLMTLVGLDPSFGVRYPHQFSGGQRQRIGIARALAVKPEVIVCDESVAALDVSIAAQILNLFADLQAELNLTYLFISHDLGVVRHISDRVAIMYLGRIVELASTKELFEQPNHPYTQALLREVPRLDRRKHHFKPIEGEIPSPINPPSGCHFHPRCPHAVDRCRVKAPELKPVGAAHQSACHLNE